MAPTLATSILSLAALAAALAACGREAPRHRVVVAAGGPVTIDGDLNEPGWRGAGRAIGFADVKTGKPATPYSEARCVHDRDRLYLGLYAADEDILSDDAFVVELTAAGETRTWRFRADGTIVPPIAGAQVGVDLDGTRDDSKDLDEEWVIEAGLPLAALPGGGKAPIAAHLSRCDHPKNGAHPCGELVLVLQLAE